MAKTILQFFPHGLKKNYGGAYSYLYQLKNSFVSNEVRLQFLSDIIPFEESNESTASTSLWKSVAKHLVPDKAIYARRIKNYLQEISELPATKKLSEINFNAFDAIHFHETVDVWRSQKLMKGYRGKIILTSHSPKPYHLEVLEDVFGLRTGEIPSSTYTELESIDAIAINKADIIVAPCQEALTSYEDSWPGFLQKLQNKEKVFIPTGIEAVLPSVPASQIRQESKIAEDAFVVCFNGRHQATKGYDLLVEAAKEALNSYHNLYFIITGQKDEPSFIKHSRWIETGWTDSPENYVNAADLIVVPNRETYFDLNVLLALSLGKPVALSETGGNRFFKSFQSPAVFFFEGSSGDSLKNALAEIYDNKENLDGSVNQGLFEKHFTTTQFAEAYNQFYLSV